MPKASAPERVVGLKGARKPLSLLGGGAFGERHPAFGMGALDIAHAGEGALLRSGCLENGVGQICGAVARSVREDGHLQNGAVQGGEAPIGVERAHNGVVAVERLQELHP